MTPAGTSDELDVQNQWEENTHTHGFIMDAAAELGRNPVSKYQIQPEYGDEQADAGRDG